MKNNKGFVLIETIIVTVVLAASLLYLYFSYSSTLIREKTRLQYDDVSYIYKAEYLKKIIKENMDEDIFNKAYDDAYDKKGYIILTTPKQKYIDGATVQSVYPNECNECKSNFTNDSKNGFNFLHMMIIKIEDIPKIKDCIQKNITNTKCSETIEYINSNIESRIGKYEYQSNLTDKNEKIKDQTKNSNFYNYLKTINIDNPKANRILLVVFSEYKDGSYNNVCNDENNVRLTKCEKAYNFAWVYFD